jgi:hypothetical protein
MKKRALSLGTRLSPSADYDKHVGELEVELRDYTEPMRLFYEALCAMNEIDPFEICWVFCSETFTIDAQFIGLSIPPIKGPRIVDGTEREAFVHKVFNESCRVRNR